MNASALSRAKADYVRVCVQNFLQLCRVAGKISSFCIFAFMVLGFMLYARHDLQTQRAPRNTTCAVAGRLEDMDQYPVCAVSLTSVKAAEALCPYHPKNYSIGRSLMKNINNKSLSFIGDSRIRDIFSFICRALRGEPYQEREKHYFDRTCNDVSRNTSLSFYWMTHPNEHLINRLLQWSRIAGSPPNYLFLQFGAWPAEFNVTDQEFHDWVENAAVMLQAMRRKTTLLWMTSLPANPAWKIKVKWVHTNPNGTIRLDRFADIVNLVMKQRGLISWSTARDISAARKDLYADYIHPGTILLEKFVCQILQAFDFSHC